MVCVHESIYPVTCVISLATLAAEYAAQAVYYFLGNRPVVLHEQIMVEL